MEDETGKTTSKVAMGVATGWIILRHRPYRRNLLFVMTLVTLALVFAGAVPLAKALMARPMLFFLFWALCFLLAGFVLMLAVYDLLQIRKEHQFRMDRLEEELSEAAEEARRLARENLEKREDSKGESD